MKKLSIKLLFIFFTTFCYSQSDECIGATVLNDVSNFCSNGSFFENETATASGFGLPTCWAATATIDVWFSFVATGTDVTISADGSTSFFGMIRPRIALYSGDCSTTITQEACANGSATSDLTNLYSGGLVVGTSYLIRISTTSGGIGTFDLCINNYTPPPAGSADCGGAIFLCDKSPFGVSGFSGGGTNTNEPNTTSCMIGGEQNSIWYYWTCETSGTLTFDITPNDNTHDVDWALYQLAGTNACVRSGNAVRCNVASCLNATGSTGLNMTDLDITETPGCNATKNAYCKFLDMVSGTSYALLINNDTGFDGVTVNWGGTGTFVGTTPIFNPISAICIGEVLAALPTTSTNGITGVWSPELNNTATTTYTFTPDPGQCASQVTLQIVVNPKVNPTFNAVPTSCEGEIITALPTTSLNSFTGTWSPALDNTTTTTYTFTPSIGECANSTTLEIIVSQKLDPTFNTVADICQGEVLNDLPTTSLNLFSGSWSPAINNNQTTVYTFTPNIGECSNSTSLEIVVIPNVTPEFDPVDDICSGENLIALPITSNNNIQGSWSPVLDNTTTTFYTFTPDANQCANELIMSIGVLPIVSPTFDVVLPICEGTIINPLPTASTNGINGTWTPALDNSNTTIYTFTPEIGFCSNSTTLEIVVNQGTSPTITCGLSTSNTVLFNWDILVGATDYTISYSINANPIITNGNQFGNSFSLDGLSLNDQVEIFVEVNGSECYLIGQGMCEAIECISPIINTQATSNTQCEGNALTFSVTENGGTAYQWQISSDGGATFTNLNDGGVYLGTSTLDLIISDNTGLDATQYQLVINEATNLCPTTSNPVVVNVNLPILPTFTSVNPICAGESLADLPLISNNNFNGTWSPALDNTSTTTYTFTPDAGECALDNTLEIVVNPIVIPTFNAIAAICNGDVLADLPLSSTNNIDGTWSPALDNTITTTYSFTPDAGQCAVTSDLTIDVVDYQTPVISCGTSTVSSVAFDWTALAGVSDYDISYSINGGLAINGGNQAAESFTLNGLNPEDVVELSLTTNGTDCYFVGTATCSASPCFSPIITTQPTAQTVCEGNQVDFTVSATESTSFQWQVSNDNGATFFNVLDFPGNISGATTNTLSITDNTGLNGLLYQVVISEIDNTCPTTSNQVLLTVNPIPVINATSNSPLCEGENLILGVNSIAGALYSWTGPLGYFSVQQNNTINSVTEFSSGDYVVNSTLNGCSSSSTIAVVVNSPIEPTINLSGPFCEEDLPTSLTADILGGIWSGNGITNSITGEFSPSQAGIGSNLITYTLVNGCGEEGTINIAVHEQANANFILDNTILDAINPQVVIQNISSNAVSYQWSFGDNSISFEENPIHTYAQEEGSYVIRLIATSSEGCSDTITQSLTIPETLIFYIPNSFTPNGDEKNNIFLPIFTSGFDPFEYQLSVYNRWGELIFESLDYRIGWDGSFKNLGIVENGTYIWKITFSLLANSDKKSLSGSFSLIK